MKKGYQPCLYLSNGSFFFLVDLGLNGFLGLFIGFFSLLVIVGFGPLVDGLFSGFLFGVPCDPPFLLPRLIGPLGRAGVCLVLFFLFPLDPGFLPGFLPAITSSFFFSWWWSFYREWQQRRPLDR